MYKYIYDLKQLRKQVSLRCFKQKNLLSIQFRSSLKWLTSFTSWLNVSRYLRRKSSHSEDASNTVDKKKTFLPYFLLKFKGASSIRSSDVVNRLPLSSPWGRSFHRRSFEPARTARRPSPWRRERAQTGTVPAQTRKTRSPSSRWRTAAAWWWSLWWGASSPWSSLNGTFYLGGMYRESFGGDAMFTDP